MTNELEKQFFKYFGIEPRYEDACTVEDKYWNNEELAKEYGTFDQYMNCKCGDQENCTIECSCAYQKEVYPEITDRILLELILLQPLSIEFKYPRNIEQLKNTLLRYYIEELSLFAEQSEAEIFKQQVKALFEEEQWIS